MNRNNPGWPNEPTRHGLASKGIKTTTKTKGHSTLPTDNLNCSDDFIEKVEKIKIPIQDIWEAWFYGSSGAGRQDGDYVIRIYPSNGKWDKIETGKKLFSERGSNYPEMNEYPVHIHPEMLIERGLRGHPDEILDTKKDFEREAEYKGIEKGSEEWEEAKKEWLYQVKDSLFHRFKSKLLDELKINGKNIDVEYTGDVEYNTDEVYKP